MPLNRIFCRDVCFSQFYSFYNYLYGNCYTFNSGRKGAVLRTSKEGPLYGEYQTWRDADSVYNFTWIQRCTSRYTCTFRFDVRFNCSVKDVSFTNNLQVIVLSPKQNKCHAL